MVRGFDGTVKPARGFGGRRSIGKDTLLFSRLRLTNVRQITGMGCAALGIVVASFVEAELAVDGETHVRGVAVFLSVILPPADRTKLHGSGGIEGSIPAAWTAVLSCGCFGLHGEWTETGGARLRCE